MPRTLTPIINIIMCALRVTIMKDKVSRESKGVAFVLFVDKASAQRAVVAVNRKELFGRTLKCSIATDNGRTTEFIKRRLYKDKSRSFEEQIYSGTLYRGHLGDLVKCPV